MVLKVKSSYTFDDVLLIPKYSEVDSRKNVDLSVDLGKGINLSIPIISANMKNVTGLNLALEVAKLGGLAILHRFFKNVMLDQIQAFKTCVEVNKNYVNHVGVSIGVQKQDIDYVSMYVENGVKIICLDVAHADCKRAVNLIKTLKSKYPNILLIAGNVATISGFYNLTLAGADVIKFGIGGGSLCTTRIETGNGVPQLSGLAEVYEYAKLYYPHVKIIADGGLKDSGSITKALCFSNAVMLGNLLAGTDEAPGDSILIDGKKYKTYAGSSTFKKENIEGVSGLVPEKGPVKNVINKLLQGVRSGCSYQGAHNLDALKNDPQFVLITGSGLIESRHHNVIIN